MTQAWMGGGASAACPSESELGLFFVHSALLPVKVLEKHRSIFAGKSVFFFGVLRIYSTTGINVSRTRRFMLLIFEFTMMGAR